MTTGYLLGWGNNKFSQLGLNDIKKHYYPLNIGGEFTDWSFISANNYSNIALKEDGSIWRWGSNLYNIILSGDDEIVDVPTQLGDSADWKIAVLGIDSVCLIDDNKLLSGYRI